MAYLTAQRLLLTANVGAFADSVGSRQTVSHNIF
jgi:hypothetical protein